MELRIWKYGSDDKYIPSFLEGMSIAHKQPAKGVDWFHWKFEQSPYGKAILACAFDNECLAGCVAYGMGRVHYQGKEWACALSYETFVRPNYQGQGLFKKLINLAEIEAKAQAIPFLYNFPNSNSLTGFKHMGWICRNDVEQYKIRITRLLHVLTNIKDLKEGFIPNKSNLDKIKTVTLDNIRVERANPNTILPIWTKEYLKWRFFTYPNREYFVINDTNVFAISMVGYRGKLKNVHILYIVSKQKNASTNNLAQQVVKKIKNNVNPDFISYSSSIGDNTLSSSFGFIKVPSHSNFCYKVLDESFTIKDFSIALPAINAHTY